MGKLGGWVQALGNIGILIGLFFVGLQLQQEKELKRAEFVAANFHKVTDGWLAVLGEDPASSLERLSFHPEELTDRDLIVLDAWFRLDQVSWRYSSFLDRILE